MDELDARPGFTAELKKKFDQGLQSTSAPYHKEIEEVAKELNISIKSVKVSDSAPVPNIWG